MNESDEESRMKGNYRALWGISYDLDANNLFSLEASYNNKIVRQNLTIFSF